MRFAKPTAIVGTALCAVLPFVSAAATPPVVAQLPSLQPGTLESPLTSISWDNANHIRVYYIDATGFVQEYGYDYGNDELESLVKLAWPDLLRICIASKLIFQQVIGSVQTT